MVKFTSSEQKKLKKVFSQLDNHDVKYVIPRDHWGLPDSINGGDIDIFVENGDFSKANEIAAQVGFDDPEKSQNPIHQYFGLATKAARNPIDAASLLVRDPAQVKQLVFNSSDSSANESLDNQFREKVKMKENIVLHMFNHIVFTSTLNDRKVRVSRSVEKKLTERRRYQDFYYIPSPPDELAHLICRGVFDRGGSFPDYYVRRCDHLWTEVSNKERFQEQLRSLLSKLFFDASNMVYRHINNSQYNSLREDLIQFTEY